MANKYNHFKLWLYQKLGVGWSAHWSTHGDLLAVYYLPPVVHYGGSAPNNRLHWTGGDSPASPSQSTLEGFTAPEADTTPPASQ